MLIPSNMLYHYFFLSKYHIITTKQESELYAAELTKNLTSEKLMKFAVKASHSWDTAYQHGKCNYSYRKKSGKR